MTVRPDDTGVPVRVDAVTFRGDSFRWPIYYGYRVGHAIGRRGVWIEAEFLHLKVIANQESLAPPVESFAITHGMNFILVNVVWAAPEHDRARVGWMVRAGLGPTLPHAESRVDGRWQEGYELGGAGIQLAPGIVVRVTRVLRMTGEYKFTFARPSVEVAGGHALAAVRTHHVAWGLAAAF
ncbi:MAG: hypothetical protein HYY76_15695 [Acidobacteria bacterium]|nr:hypothetical protein [Acidobacteriota bacterium]